MFAILTMSHSHTHAYIKIESRQRHGAVEWHSIKHISTPINVQKGGQQEASLSSRVGGGDGGQGCGLGQGCKWQRMRNQKHNIILNTLAILQNGILHSETITKCSRKCLKWRGRAKETENESERERDRERKQDT